MTHEEQFRRNLEHAFELFDVLLDHPSELDKIPDDANVVLMPSDDPELCAANEAMLRTSRMHSESPHNMGRQRALDDSTLLVNV